MGVSGDPVYGVPAVEWRRRECGCWLLRVYLTPQGWRVQGRDFRVEPNEWLRRLGAESPEGNVATTPEGVDINLAARDRGEIHFWSLRVVEGMLEYLPHDLDAWPTGRPEIGCSHWPGVADIGDLAADCRLAINTPSRKWPVARSVT